VKAIVRQLRRFKSVAAVGGKPAPLLIQDGWTDPAFDASEALRVYGKLRGRSFVSLQLGDLGHFRAGNAPAMTEDFAADGVAFLDRYLKGRPGGPRNRSVKVYGQGCPKGRLGPGPFELSSYGELAGGSVRRSVGPRTLSGGDSDTGSFFNPVANGDPCSTKAPEEPPGGIVLRARRDAGFTLAGRTTVVADIAKPPGRWAQIDARLFDAGFGRERMIDYGTFRVRPDQKGRIEFQLSGNVYRFAPGLTARVELTARNEPFFLADDPFSVRFSKVAVRIPTIEAYGPR
jgi:hypothetical protein